MKYEPPPDAHVRVLGQVVSGYGVASGVGKDPRFPAGTLAPQWPHFAAVADLPLDDLHRATLNVSTTPWHVDLVAPWWTLEDVQWHPDTKPDHHQPPDVLELLLPHRRQVHPGAIVRLDLPASQVEITGPAVTDPAAVDPYRA